MVKEYKFLTQSQVDHFLEHGWLKLEKAFTAEKASIFTHDMWIRLGMDPNDKSTWTKERIHMPLHRTEPVQTFCPVAWGAMCELLGGEERVNPNAATWNDCLIVNLGTEEWETKSIAAKELDNWHCDGDFFRHFLDSPEQGLLVIPLYGDIKPRGGGTYIAEDSIGVVAKHLLDHPEGILPGQFGFPNLLQQCNKFTELTGELGDVILLHPLMLHSASKNHLRLPRVITNPPVSLKEPFVFSRENKDDYSVVERKTLDALGRDILDFKPTAPREKVVPARLKVQNVLVVEERERMRKHQEALAKQSPVQQSHVTTVSA